MTCDPARDFCVTSRTNALTVLKKKINLPYKQILVGKVI